MTKTILITGAAGGIGRATVSLFAQKGWRVIGVDRNEFGGDFPEAGLFIPHEIKIPTALGSIVLALEKAEIKAQSRDQVASAD